MGLKRFIVELGMGVDLHGENVTEAACRAVKDAIGRSCLCGLIEIFGIERLDAVHVDILLATPRPVDVDVRQVIKEVPIGEVNVIVEEGGMSARGLCVDRFGPSCDRIVVANAAVTVSIDPSKQPIA